MSKATIKRSSKKESHLFDIQFKKLTEGEVIALFNALNDSQSRIAFDLKAYLSNAIVNSDCEELKPLA